MLVAPRTRATLLRSLISLERESRVAVSITCQIARWNRGFLERQTLSSLEDDLGNSMRRSAQVKQDSGRFSGFDEYSRQGCRNEVGRQLNPV